jgi:phosphoglycerate dehydrogenase-like enzyme
MSQPPRRPRVAVLCNGHPRPRIPEVERAAEVDYVTSEGLAAALPGADVLLVWDFLSTALPGAWPAEGGPGWVHVAAAGVDRFVFPALTRSGTVLTNSRGVFEQPMAEYVLGLVLAMAKDLPGTLGLQRERRWRHRESERVEGRAALVVGAGPIGRAIARQLALVRLRVTVVGRTRRHDPDLGGIVPASSLHDLLPEADYVVLAAPLTPDTRGLVDAAALGRMRPTARFINVSRGALVVEADLVAALRAGRIAGAALDVFEHEPLPAGSPLWELPGVIVSPHMSGDVIGWRDALAAVFVDNFRRFTQGRPLRNVVDHQLGYVPTSSQEDS